MTRYWTQAPTIRVQSLSPWIKREAQNVILWTQANMNIYFLSTPHVVLVVKNPPPCAGDIRDSDSILGPEGPLEQETATHSGIPAWSIAMGRGARWAAVHCVTKCGTWLSVSTATFKTINGHTQCTMFYGILLIFSWHYLGNILSWDTIFHKSVHWIDDVL